MDRLQAMAAFVAVVDSGGFARAARRLNLSPPVVTRAVVELEERLALRLLTRNTRVVRVTEAGARYAEDCRRILAEVDAAEGAAQVAHEVPQGTLVVTAPALFGRLYVTGIVVDYLRRHPGVDATCLFHDRVVNLMEEKVDVAVRIAELPDSSLKAVRVGSVRRLVVAAPSYLAEHGTPQRPEDLAAHTLIGSGAPTAASEWHFVVGGRNFALPVRPRMTTTTNDIALAAAVAGFGLARLVSYQAAAELKSGGLVPVLEAFGRPPVPVSVVRGPGARPPPKVSAFVELAVETLRAQLAG